MFQCLMKKANGSLIKILDMVHLTEGICKLEIAYCRFRLLSESCLRNIPMLFRTEALCEIAVRKSWGSIRDVPDLLRTEKLCLTVVQNCDRNDCWQLIPPALQLNKAILAAFYVKKPLKLLPPFLWTNEDFLIEMCKQGHPKHLCLQRYYLIDDSKIVLTSADSVRKILASQEISFSTKQTILDEMRQNPRLILDQEFLYDVRSFYEHPLLFYYAKAETLQEVLSLAISSKANINTISEYLHMFNDRDLAKKLNPDVIYNAITWFAEESREFSDDKQALLSACIQETMLSISPHCFDSRLQIHMINSFKSHRNRLVILCELAMGKVRFPMQETPYYARLHTRTLVEQKDLVEFRLDLRTWFEQKYNKLVLNKFSLCFPRMRCHQLPSSMLDQICSQLQYNVPKCESSRFVCNEYGIFETIPFF